jgi:hypothetical protein
LNELIFALKRDFAPGPKSVIDGAIGKFGLKQKNRVKVSVGTTQYDTLGVLTSGMY